MLRKLLVLSIVVAALGGGVATHTAKADQFKSNNAWIKLWAARDESIYPAMRVAAAVFHVSYYTLKSINDGEGGNINPRTLHRSLCSGSQPGWNLRGSYAFGPMQFMLSKKPACSGGWGTFSTYASRAFAEAKRLGFPIPARFKSPASNVGQAITTAYMLANPKSTGGISHWCASQC